MKASMNNYNTSVYDDNNSWLKQSHYYFKPLQSAHMNFKKSR